MLGKSSKLCFIIPEYHSSIPTHFNYIYDLIGGISKASNVVMVAEKGGGQPDFISKNKFYLQKFKFLPLRIMENFLLLGRLRLSGCRDFYIHYSFLSAFNASLISKILGGRVFYWNCGLPWLYRRSVWREQFERLVYRLVDFLVTGTEGLKGEYARHYQLPVSKIKVLPNWVNVEEIKSRKLKIKREELRNRLNIPDGSEILLFAHRLSRRKGAHYLPDILKALEKQNLVLIVIGDGPERQNLESRIQNLKLNARVRFLGWVPNREVLPYFAIADIFIMPSEEEGFPRSLLEAMAAEVPFVAFNVGGVGEITPPELSRYLAAGDNLGEFIEKIQELLHTDLKHLEVLKRSELNWARQFDLKFAAERFKNLF